MPFSPVSEVLHFPVSEEDPEVQAAIANQREKTRMSHESSFQPFLEVSTVHHLSNKSHQLFSRLRWHVLRAPVLNLIKLRCLLCFSVHSIDKRSDIKCTVAICISICLLS